MSTWFPVIHDSRCSQNPIAVCKLPPAGQFIGVSTEKPGVWLNKAQPPDILWHGWSLLLFQLIENCNFFRCKIFAEHHPFLHHDHINTVVKINESPFSFAAQSLELCIYTAPEKCSGPVALVGSAI